MRTKAAESLDGRIRRAVAARESRRAEILERAVRVFGAKGYHKTSISDVVEAAGVARGTFYLYFESKNAIFLELLDQLLAQFRSTVVGVELGPGAPSLYEQLLGAVKRVLELSVSNRPLITIIFREAIGLDSDVDQKLREFYANLRHYLVEALELGRHMGVVRDVDTQVCATCILGSIRQVIEQHLVLESDDAIDIDRYANAILEFNARGVLSHD